MKRAQSSVEYLFVVGLSLMLIIPASYLFYSYSQSSQEAVIGAQINRAGLELIDEAEALYSIGSGSWTTLELNFPDDVQSVTIYDGIELVITYSGKNGMNDAVFFSQVPLSNDVIPCVSPCLVDIYAGTNQVRLTSRGDFISVNSG